MRITCSYCQKDLGTKEPFENDMISHSICKSCLEMMLARETSVKIGEFLDRYDAPVLVVTGSGSVIAMNRAMSDKTDLSPREAFGLMGGDLLRCRYACQPAGCGNQVQCQYCTVRKLVEHVISTKENKEYVPAFVEQESAKLNLVLSAYQDADNVIRLVVHELGVEKY